MCETPLLTYTSLHFSPPQHNLSQSSIAHLVTLSSHVSKRHDSLRSREEGVEDEAVELLVERVFRDIDPGGTFTDLRNGRYGDVCEGPW